MKRRLISIDLLLNNDGQIKGVPANPRTIKDEKFQKLCKSIGDLPEMMELRELIVFPWKSKFIAIAGNQRLSGCRELKWDKVPCKVLPPETPAAKLKEIAIKDNIASGEDDIEALETDWNLGELEEWGFPVELLSHDQDEEAEQEAGAGNFEHMKRITLKYSEAEHEQVKKALQAIADTPEHAVLKLLGLIK